MGQPASKNLFLDNDDLRFQFDRVDWKTLVELQEAGFNDEDRFTDPAAARAFYEEMLTSLGEFLAREVLPHDKVFDEEHPTFDKGVVHNAPMLQETYDKLAALGAMGLTLPRRLGGMNAPLLINNILFEMLARTDASVTAHFGFYGGLASALMLYSLEEGSTTFENGYPVKGRFDDVIERIATGHEWGAMVLTEPDAGSDLGRMKATATPHDDGSWRLSGQKIYITAGHGEHHIVIARTEDEATHPGLKGLSLFYVPGHVDAHNKRCTPDADGAKRNFVVGGIEKKMGQRSAVAATIHYEDSIAELIGTRGEGFKGMLTLMNGARIAVAFESLGVCEAAYRMARAWAEERVTMGKPIARHEMIAEYLDDMDVNIRALRAMTFDAAFHEECAQRIRVQLRTRPPAAEDERKALEKKARRHQRRARLLTPLIKYQGGEEAVRMARLNMQIFGGLGYIVETGAEKILRDALVIPVYEGTSQIQALMALKDNLGDAIKNPARFAREVGEARLLALSSKDPLEKGAARLKVHALSAMQTILSRIAADKLGSVQKKPLAQWRSAFEEWDPSRDFSFGMLHAERLTKLLIWAHQGEVLVQQASSSVGGAHEHDRRELALRYLERHEPKARGVLGEIEATSVGFFRTVLGRGKKDGNDMNLGEAAE